MDNNSASSGPSASADALASIPPLARAFYKIGLVAQEGAVPAEQVAALNEQTVSADIVESLLGTRFVSISKDEVVLELEIADKHLQPWGVTNGGVYAILGETAGSIAGYIAAGGKSNVMGTNNSTDFLRPSRKGDVIRTTARAEHLGRTMQLWRIEHVNKNTGKLCALTRLKTTVLPLEK